MSGERQGLIEPYLQARDEELQEVNQLFDAVVNDIAEGHHQATGPVRNVEVPESGGKVNRVPIKVTFRHTMYNVGKIQELGVYGVTPKQTEVELGHVVRTFCIGHTVGELPPPMIDVFIGNGETAKKMGSMEQIFADEDAQQLFDMLRQYSGIE